MIPTPPLPEPARNISYPKIAERQLSNGLGVIVIREDHLPKVSVKLALPVGRVHNPDRNLALLQLAVELIKEGTHQRSSREISELMDQLAIHYESDLSLENVLLSFEVLENHREPAVELFSDMVCHPSFPEEELDRLKVRWRSTPAGPAFSARFFGPGTHLSFPLSGTIPMPSSAFPSSTWRAPSETPPRRSIVPIFSPVRHF